MKIFESHLEQTALSWFESLGYQVLNAPDIAPGELQVERDSYSEVVLKERLREAVYRLNPNVSAQALEDAIRKVLHPDSPDLNLNNRAFSSDAG